MKLKEQNKQELSSLISHLSSPVCFWVDSSGGPKHLCNQSFYGANPKYYFYGSLNEVYLNNQHCKINCFDFLEKKINEEKHNKDGVFVGYVSYDIFKNVHHSIGSLPPGPFYERAGRASPQKGGAHWHSDTYKDYPDFFFAYFEDPVPCHPEALKVLKSDTLYKNLSSNMTDLEYLQKVKQIKEEIKKGNVYQVNLTREYFIESKSQRANEPVTDDLSIYFKLREVSPNPYGCYFKTPFLSILSSSPEEFLYINNNYIRTRPIKGTLPKNVFEIDPKNQAENIMIVDLERNDLGKICKTGSVKANKLLEIEEYEHLNHIVSTIEGELREKISLREILEAVFPGGSITGAPKIAAMKIIDEIEPTKRGAYTGTFGYIKTDGTMNFNILIRTIFIEPMNQRTNEPESPIRISFNVGGGIVADSDPEAELEEIKLKAKGIITALGLC